MAPLIRQLVQRIHDTPVRVVLAVTGGGSRAISELLEVPGASRTLLEAVVPYSPGAMSEWVGGRPDQFCSEPTGRAMAMAAYLRACRYRDIESDATAGQASSGTPVGRASSGAPMSFDVAGVACTASLASDRPKRGPHRIHVALQTAETTLSRSVELVKGRRTRAEEEQIATSLVLNCVAQACGLDERLELGLLTEEVGENEEKIDEREVIALRPWQELLAGSVNAVAARGTAEPGDRPTQVVFPGSFHPLHSGHRRMAEIAAAQLGVPVEFEISIINVEKPPLDFIEIEDRVSQFPQHVVWLTRAPTMEEKSARFPGATFVVGVDTMRRIADPRYHGDPAAWQAAMGRIAARGCRFLVFGREQGGRFVGLEELELPPALRILCRGVPAEVFREDISSTALRGQT